MRCFKVAAEQTGPEGSTTIPLGSFKKNIISQLCHTLIIHLPMFSRYTTLHV